MGNPPPVQPAQAFHSQWSSVRSTVAPAATADGGKLQSVIAATLPAPQVVPERLPFLESLSWFDACWRDLSALEMLQRYERGWRNRGVTADLGGEELAFVRALVERFGSEIDVPA